MESNNALDPFRDAIFHKENSCQFTKVFYQSDFFPGKHLIFKMTKILEFG